MFYALTINPSDAAAVKRAHLDNLIWLTFTVRRQKMREKATAFLTRGKRTEPLETIAKSANTVYLSAVDLSTEKYAGCYGTDREKHSTGRAT